RAIRSASAPWHVGGSSRSSHPAGKPPASSSDEIPAPARYNPAGSLEAFVAQADIIIADDKLLPQAVEIYNGCFRPKREIDYFKRRFMARYNALTLLARMNDRPVGFWVGFELKPGMFYHWLGAVVQDLRRHGVGRQLQEAQ